MNKSYQVLHLGRRTLDKVPYLQGICRKEKIEWQSWAQWVCYIRNTKYQDLYLRICLRILSVQEHQPSFRHTEIRPLLNEDSGNTQNKRWTRLYHTLRARFRVNNEGNYLSTSGKG